MTIQQDLYKINQAMLRLQKSGCGMDIPISLSEYNYIIAINELAQPTISSIAERLGISKPSVTTMVKKLIAAGLVERAEDALDRRRSILSLSEQGRGIIECDIQMYQSFIDLLDQRLSAAEYSQVEDILQLVAERL